jgi:hypothetical protein
MCHGKISVLSLLVLHNTGDDFMCSGKISVLSLLVLHNTGDDFMYPLFCVGLIEKELLSLRNR